MQQIEEKPQSMELSPMEIPEKTREKVSPKENPAWSNLHPDILGLIFKYLYFIDRIHCRAVCKNWSVVYSASSINKLPWLTKYKLGSILSFCEFTDPSLESDQTYSDLFSPTYTIKKQLSGEEMGMEAFRCASVLASRKGWLLLKSGRKQLIYNPFKNLIINLPELDTGSFLATFSGTPTSSDCIVCAMEYGFDEKVNIRTCRYGEAGWNWNSYSFSNCPDNCNFVVYSKATLYCLFNYGKLGAFNTINEEWSVLINERPRIPRGYKCYLVETDGEPLLVLSPRSCHKFHQGDFLVYKCDFLKGAWCKQENLGNRVVFLQLVSDSTSFSVSAEGDTRYLANRIYYNNYACSWFYSFETRLHHLCSEDHLCSISHPWPAEKDKRREWIEPPDENRSFLCQLQSGKGVGEGAFSANRSDASCMNMTMRIANPCMKRTI